MKAKDSAPPLVMIRNPIPALLVALGFGTSLSFGQSKSSSASYEILHSAPGGIAGKVSNGSNIAAQVTVGGTNDGTVSAETPGGVQLKPGFIGQLYDVVSITLGASPSTIDEGGTRQLGAVANLDDNTTLNLPGGDVQWSILLGPLTEIDASGLTTADLVYEDTAATAQGGYQGLSAQIELTVLNTDPDNLGTYAGDGLDDGWQVNFFGHPPNPEAAPNANPDNDLHPNLFEFLTGYNPTDPHSYFTFDVLDVADTMSILQLSKIVPGTRYSIERSLDLGHTDPWTEFATFTTLSEIFDHQVTDPNAAGPHWFYRVAVER